MATKKLTGRGGPGRGQGRKPKPPSEKYRAISVKLPPHILDWMADNIDNRNGFIVQSVIKAIEENQTCNNCQNGVR